MPPKARVKAKPTRTVNGRRAGGQTSVGSTRDKRRNVVQLQVTGKMAALYKGEISVADMDMDELARMQFKDKNGRFSGRPPTTLPAQLVNLIRHEMAGRLAEKRREVLEEMQEVLIGVARNKNESAADRIRAANLIIERELGKTPDKVELGGGGKPIEHTIARAVKHMRPQAPDDE